MIYALKQWRQYFFEINSTEYTGHSSLTTWKTNRDLSGRKGCSIEPLSEFPATVMYSPRQHIIFPDASSRRSDYELNQTSVLKFPSLVERFRFLRTQKTSPLPHSMFLVPHPGNTSSLRMPHLDEATMNLTKHLYSNFLFWWNDFDFFVLKRQVLFRTQCFLYQR